MTVPSLVHRAFAPWTIRGICRDAPGPCTAIRTRPHAGAGGTMGGGTRAKEGVAKRPGTDTPAVATRPPLRPQVNVPGLRSP
jgi:hypothetical protein